MYSMVAGGGLHGLNSFIVAVEVDVSSGLPCFDLVGHLSHEVAEAKQRVRVALKNNGIKLPPSHITVNLSPADIRKEGTGYDLPMAVGILMSLGLIPDDGHERILFIGELGLNGEIGPVKGVLPLVMRARAEGIKYCIVPDENLEEAFLVSDINIAGAASLKQVMDYMKDPEEYPDFFDMRTAKQVEEKTGGQDDDVDFADIFGQEPVKRACEIAAAGFHNMMMVGPPGSGKTLMARAFSSILPPMSMEESLEVTSIYSVAGKLSADGGLIRNRTFVAPHHTVTALALTGGGNRARPGLISMAHRGVLFLDEMTEFKKITLEVLRQPLEDRKVMISRSNASYTYPADFLLLGAMNPCPCGYYPNRGKCRCTDPEIRRYLGKISGPLLDRMDLVVETPAVNVAEMLKNLGPEPESSETIRDRVTRAREIQESRYKNLGIRVNSELGAGQIKEYCPLGKEEEHFLEMCSRAMGISARGCHRILKVARTIADLEGSRDISRKHLNEAVMYKGMDQSFWDGGM